MNHSDFFRESKEWNDYALLDTGEGMKLERFSARVLARPEPSAIWKRALPKEQWDTAAGAEVTHVDASKKIIAWARENQKLSKLEDHPVRWIIDDALKFVKREVRRGAKYDGFIIDPPKFGRGPKNEVWKIYEDLPILLDECQKLFSDNLLFVNLTCYAIRITPLSLHYALEERLVGHHGIIEQGELTLREQSASRILPQAVCARWSV